MSSISLKISKSIVTAGLTFSIFAITNAASGDTIEARFDSVTPGQSIEYLLNQDKHDHDNDYVTTTAGNFNWTRIGGNYDGPGASGQFTSYCIELNQYIGYGNVYTYDVTNLEDAPIPGKGMGEVKSSLISELFGSYYSNDFDKTEATAFQVAIWEIVNEDNNDCKDDLKLDLGKGDFKVKNTGDFYDQAQLWLDGLDGEGPTADLIAMSNKSVQDHVTVIPTPGTLAIASLAASFIMGGRRRKNINL